MCMCKDRYKLMIEMLREIFDVTINGRNGSKTLRKSIGIGKISLSAGDPLRAIIGAWLEQINFCSNRISIVATVASLLTCMIRYIVPPLRYYCYSMEYDIPLEELTTESLISEISYCVSRLKAGGSWDKFIPVFEKWNEKMKSFKEFNVDILSDFLATNELHDLWLIVVTNKKYSEESANDRFSI